MHKVNFASPEHKAPICAHCRQPIHGEFVTGIKFVAPGEIGVLFHKDRAECLAASEAGQH